MKTQNESMLVGMSVYERVIVPHREDCRRRCNVACVLCDFHLARIFYDVCPYCWIIVPWTPFEYEKALDQCQGRPVSLQFTFDNSWEYSTMPQYDGKASAGRTRNAAPVPPRPPPRGYLRGLRPPQSPLGDGR